MNENFHGKLLRLQMGATFKSFDIDLASCMHKCDPASQNHQKVARHMNF